MMLGVRAVESDASTLQQWRVEELVALEPRGGGGEQVAHHGARRGATQAIVKREVSLVEHVGNRSFRICGSAERGVQRA